MEFTKEQKVYGEIVPKTEENTEGIVDSAELTNDQLEIVAGGTGYINGGCILDPFTDKFKIPGLPIENP